MVWEVFELTPAVNETYRAIIHVTRRKAKNGIITGCKR